MKFEIIYRKTFSTDDADPICDKSDGGWLRGGSGEGGNMNHYEVEPDDGYVTCPDCEGGEK